MASQSLCRRACTLFDSIARSVGILERNQIEYALLECTSEYPAKPEFIRLLIHFKIGANVSRSDNWLFRSLSRPNYVDRCNSAWRKNN